MAGSTAVYEGSRPYIFISYSHKDMAAFSAAQKVLTQNRIRFWYDNGLHSGDDWNMVIAKHLQNASLCLLLLSENSANSNYVKNELNFAVNHRIPIHVLMIGKMLIPPDIEIMLGRTQMIDMTGGFEEKLIKALPPEVFAREGDGDSAAAGTMAHPLFDAGDVYLDRQGTESRAGRHKRLKYRVMVQTDTVNPTGAAEAFEHAALVSGLDHPLFPRIYDVVSEHGRIITYQEFRGEVFLDEYLKTHALTQDQILRWVTDIVSGLKYLYGRNMAFRDLARGSLVVLEDGRIGMFRLQNMYYGPIRLQQDNRQYYFESGLGEIAVLISQLCTGQAPVLPLRIIEAEHLSKAFLRRMNLVAQKCVREYGKAMYQNYDQLLEDLSRGDISVREALFLKKRAKKLAEYDRIKGKNTQIFTGEGTEVRPAVPFRTDSLEEEFGFDGTIFMGNRDKVAPDGDDDDHGVVVQVCSTGQVLRFSQSTVEIGRDTSCAVVLSQPTVSRKHTRIIREDPDHYSVTDLNSSNGTYVTAVDGGNVRVDRGQSKRVARGECIVVGSVQIRLL